jgi:hypothetical protein
MLMTLSLGAQTTRPAEEESAVVLRTYSIADLVRATQDYPLPNGVVAPQIVAGSTGLFGGGGGGGAPGAYPGGFMPGAGMGMEAPAPQHTGVQSPVVSVDSIIRLLQETIRPESWLVNGGAEGSISSLGSLLIIRQSTEAHQQIEALLSQLREDLGPTSMVCVRAYWVLLTPDDTAKIMGKGIAAPATLPVMPEDLVEKEKLYCQLQTLCFSGQTVHLTSGRERTFINDVDVVVGTNAVGIAPKASTLHAGVELQIRAQLVPGSAFAVVDVTSVVSEIDQIETTPVRAPTTQSTSTDIDRKNGVRQELQTTVRLPLGKKVFLGGMTLEPAKGDGKQVYLVLEVSGMVAN